MTEEIRHGLEVPEQWQKRLAECRDSQVAIRSTFNEFLIWHMDQQDVHRTMNDRLWHEIYDHYGLESFETTKWYVFEDSEGVWKFAQRERRNPHRTDTNGENNDNA